MAAEEQVRGGDQPAEGAGDVVVAALGQDTPGDGKPAGKAGILRRGGQFQDQLVHTLGRRRRLGDARRTEDDHRVVDAFFLKQLLRLQIVELQADAAHVAASKEGRIFIGGTIGGARQNLRDPFRRAGVLLGRLGLEIRQRRLARARIGRRRHARRDTGRRIAGIGHRDGTSACLTGRWTRRTVFELSRAILSPWRRHGEIGALRPPPKRRI